MERGGFLAIGVFVLLALAVIYGLASQIRSMHHLYQCENENFTIQSADLLLCTNETYACKNTSVPVLNKTFSLCTNTSGVGVINQTPSPGFSAYNESATDNGVGGTDYALLSLIVVILLAGLIVIIKSHSER